MHKALEERLDAYWRIDVEKETRLLNATLGIVRQEAIVSGISVAREFVRDAMRRDPQRDPIKVLDAIIHFFKTSVDYNPTSLDCFIDEWERAMRGAQGENNE